MQLLDDVDNSASSQDTPLDDIPPQLTPTQISPVISKVSSMLEQMSSLSSSSNSPPTRFLYRFKTTSVHRTGRKSRTRKHKQRCRRPLDAASEFWIRNDQSL